MTQLLASDVKTVGANGRAVCQVQPLRAFEWWHITITTIQSTSSILVPTLRLYRGGESPSSMIDGTYRGTLNSTADPIDLQNGERLLAVFEGADVGSQCTLAVTGDLKGR